MPTYAYACTACDHRFEVQQAFSDAALSECPECTGRLRKVFSAVGIVFKGSGFYRTDSRTGSGKGSRTASEPASTKSTETTPAGATSATTKDAASATTSSSSSTPTTSKKAAPATTAA